MATGSSQEDPHVCAVCLGNFRDPKFLPCHHTFCAACIQDLAYRHPGSSFPCPACRRKFTLPSEGVATLQTNFYIQPQTTQTPSGSPVMCTRHPDEKLKFYCVQCDEVICRDCKIIKHEGHPTDDLPSAVTDKRKKLLTDRPLVQGAVSAVREEVTSLREERQLQAEKRATVEKNIRARHATVVAIADRERDEALSSLQSVDTDLDKDIGSALEQREGDLAQLEDLLQHLDDTVASGTDSDVITVAMDMTSGRGSPQKVQALTSRKERNLQRPVFHFDVSTDVIAQTIRGYVGRVHTMEMKERRPEVKVTERFQCAQDPDVEIFSLCHKDTDPPCVSVSYEWCGMKKDAPVKEFTETGECVGIAGDLVGKVSTKRFAKGRCMCPVPVTGRFATDNKSPTAAHFQLDNTLSGQADINTVTVTSKDPFKSELKTEFTIQVGPHRAFDVDDSCHHFAVVEEGRESTARRCVCLYRWSVKQAICTYSPPTADFQPSDVCFYTLGGQEVLLITDEMNDNVHVVTIEGDTLRFQRYLCESSPSLIQPMAITVDVQGRLWVGCRGGAVLTIEQLD